MNEDPNEQLGKLIYSGYFIENDTYSCPMCNGKECQFCDDEYQCSECEFIEKGVNK